MSSNEPAFHKARLAIINDRFQAYLAALCKYISKNFCIVIKIIGFQFSSNWLSLLALGIKVISPWHNNGGSSPPSTA